MAREQVVIRVDGENGVHGSNHETQCASNTTSERGELKAQESVGSGAGSGARASRLQGNNGRHGRNATSPSAGTAARKVCVELSSSEKPGVMVVTGYGPSVGYRSEVPSSHNLFISARGGNGGNGGWGESGQDGGDGLPGRDADDWHPGGQGGPGGNGGDAGSGTDGGNGGHGGNIEVRIREHDMCLLMALDWDNTGGHGGVQGRHGKPGSGGRGGRGGEGYSWVEHHDPRVYDEMHRGSRSATRHMPGGHPGPVGHEGSPAKSILRNGPCGRIGQIQFVVVFTDGTISKYPSRYDLRIENCMLKDENDDGICEPGEHIMAQNIMVRNYGQMPSPSQSRIRIAIVPSQWVEPNVDHEILQVPISIPGHTSVLVPGMVKALIKPEVGSLRSPVPLKVNEAIRLEGIMSEINRRLIGFGVTCPFVVQYPVRLTQVCFPEVINRGEPFNIQWSVENISTQTQGIHSDIHRTISTRIFAENERVVLLGEEEKGVLDREIHGINPQETLTFQQQIIVPGIVEVFSKGSVKLELMLSPPNSRQDPIDDLSTRSLAQFSVHVSNLEMHVSPKYQYNRSSSYLLLINANTSEAFVRHISTFIRHDLMLDLDIFNINLHASLTEESGENILERYTGKTIIVLNNIFTFFGSIGRSMYELLDPLVVSRLLCKDTKFLFLYTQDLAGFNKTWGKMVANPAIKADASGIDGSSHCLGSKDFLETLQKTVTEGDACIFKAHSVPVMKSCMRSDESAIKYMAKKLSKKLQVRYPTRNFACRGVPIDKSKDARLSLMAHEALPLSGGIYASSKACESRLEALDSVLQYLIVASLPLSYRSRRVWDLAAIQGSDKDSQNCSAESTPSTEKESMFPSGAAPANGEKPAPGPASHPDQDTRIPRAEIERFLQVSVEYDFTQELSQFLYASPRLFDPLRKHSLSPHLPRLTTFFGQLPGNDKMPSTEVPKTIEWFTYILAKLQVITAPTIFGKSYCRKSYLSQHLEKEIKLALTTHFGQSAAKSIDQAIRSRLPVISEQYSALRSSSEKIPGTSMAVVANLRALNEVLGLPATAQQPSIDLGLELFKEYRTSVICQSDYFKLQNEMTAFEKRLRQDEERGIRIRRELIGHGNEGTGDQSQVQS